MDGLVSGGRCAYAPSNLAGRGLIVTFVAGFIAVESIVAACVLSLVHFKTSNNRATKSEHMLLELERMLSTVAGAETSQRGYLITGSDDYLTLYRDALTTLERQVSRIGGLTRDNAVQQDQVAYLATQVEQRSEEMDHAIATRCTTGRWIQSKISPLKSGKRKAGCCNATGQAPTPGRLQPVHSRQSSYSTQWCSPSAAS